MLYSGFKPFLRAENYFLPFLLYVRKVKRTVVILLHKKTENKESESMISEKELGFKMGNWNNWKHEPRGRGVWRKGKKVKKRFHLTCTVSPYYEGFLHE